jgi:sporulation protein YqfC
MNSSPHIFTKKLSAAAKIPKDLGEGALLVSVVGNEELCIENFGGILEYCDTRLCLKGKNCKVVVVGRQLSILSYDEVEMRVTGKIEQICYQ